MISSESNRIDCHIGEKMQLARVMAGITTEDLASALRVTPEEIRAYEAGERMGAAMLFTIGKILHQPMSYFFDGLPSG